MTTEGSYGHRPLWQWLVVYAVIGIIVYGLIYYFVLANPASPLPSPVKY